MPSDSCKTGHLLKASVGLLQNLGLDWDERVLPSIGNEIVKAAVAQYNAEQLLTQRDRVSRAVSWHWSLVLLFSE